MIDILVNVLAYAVSSGENFLPDPASYDDLFYKLVETGDILTKFRDTFSLSSSGAMQVLVNVSSHYHSLLAWDKFREADFKSLLKKIARMAVEDAKALNEQ